METLPGREQKAGIFLVRIRISLRVGLELFPGQTDCTSPIFPAGDGSIPGYRYQDVFLELHGDNVFRSVSMCKAGVDEHLCACLQAWQRV